MTGTIKCRIALAVDERGYWGAYGWLHKDSPADEDMLMAHAVDELADPKVYWVEVEVPVPTVDTIQAEAKPVEGEA